jgi:hypothetical protein
MYHNTRKEQCADIFVAVLRCSLLGAMQLRDEEVCNEISDPFRRVLVNSGLLECVTALFHEISPTFRMDLVTSGLSNSKRRAIFRELFAHKIDGNLVIQKIGCQSFKDTASHAS